MSSPDEPRPRIVRAQQLGAQYRLGRITFDEMLAGLSEQECTCGPCPVHEAKPEKKFPRARGAW